MEADDVIIEYLRSKLKGGRAARAESVLKPAPVAEEATMEGEPSEQELAELEALMGEGGEEDEEDEMEG